MNNEKIFLSNASFYFSDNINFWEWKKIRPELIVAAETTFDLDLNLYPNPARGVICIDSPLNQTLHYEILQSNGDVLSKGELDKGRNKIELRSTGIFFIKFSSGDVRRVVIKSNKL